MGVNVSVENKTPYIWYFSTQRDRTQYTCIHPGCTTSYQEEKAVHRYIYFKYDKHDWNTFEFEFNTHKGHTTFILRETGSQIQLYCTSEGLSQYCPNPGKS